MKKIVKRLDKITRRTTRINNGQKIQINPKKARGKK